MRRLLFLVVVVGCSSSSGPKITVNGDWSYEAPDLATSGASCSVTATLTLDQTGATFSGTYSDGLRTCVINGVQSSSGPVQGSVFNGTVSGDAVSFNIQTQGTWVQTGTISGNSMTGSANVTYATGTGGMVTLSGSWSATKQ